MTRIELHLSPQHQPRRSLAGPLAVTFGLVGVFAFGIVFVPLALVFGIAAVVRGQWALGFIGLALAVLGFLTSPTLMALLGLGAVAWFFHLHAPLPPPPGIAV